MRAPSPPKPPDPKETAQAQGAQNRSTAITQQLLNQTNQYTPYGSLEYDQIGEERILDELTGKYINVPRYSATTTLSPEQQAMLDQQQRLGTSLNELAIGQTDRLRGHLDRPVDLSNEATEARLMELGRRRLDPIYNEREDALRTRLSNQGLAPGTEAYDRAYRNEAQARNDAYTSLLLGGRGQAVSEALAERNQPINEIGALMSGGQVSTPQFVSTPQTPVAGVDYAGLVQDNYRAEMNAYNQRLAQQQGLLGGLFGLGSSLLGGWALSDRRVKEDIKKVGKLDDGTNLYKYRYKGSPLQQIGVMAQEIEKTKPEAVAEIDGTKIVNYDAITEGL